MGRVHVDSPGTMPVPRKELRSARKRQLRHPNGRRVRNVSMADEHLAYLTELSDDWNMALSAVIGKLVYEQGQREDPPRNLPLTFR